LHHPRAPPVSGPIPAGPVPSNRGISRTSFHGYSSLCSSPPAKPSATSSACTTAAAAQGNTPRPRRRTRRAGKAGPRVERTTLQPSISEGHWRPLWDLNRAVTLAASAQRTLSSWPCSIKPWHVHHLPSTAMCRRNLIVDPSVRAVCARALRAVSRPPVTEPSPGMSCPGSPSTRQWCSPSPSLMCR